MTMYDWLALQTGIDSEFLKTIVAPVVAGVLSPLLIWAGRRLVACLPKRKEWQPGKRASLVLECLKRPEEWVLSGWNEITNGSLTVGPVGRTARVNDKAIDGLTGRELRAIGNAALPLLAERRVEHERRTESAIDNALLDAATRPAGAPADFGVVVEDCEADVSAPYRPGLGA